MKIDLCIFTNCIKSAPSTVMVEKTYNSFFNAFGPVDNVTIYMDYHGPRQKMKTKYRQNLLLKFGNVVQTTSLSDGYIQAVKNSDAHFIFMLEGDWIFKKENIKHNLFLICDIMKYKNLVHLRFNKRENQPEKWDKTLKEIKLENYIDGDLFYWCETPVLSNNPHIINRELYIKKCLPYIKVVPGSKGIEENLTARPELTGGIYGSLGHPACIEHLDGRK